MRIHILFSFRDGPWGGCNQFLKALRKSFLASKIYSHQVISADIILFDSFNNLFMVLYFKLRYPNKFFFHRIDGPISIYRGKDLIVDKIIHRFSRFISDGVVFQSNYSAKQNFQLGMIKPSNYTVISNTPDSTIFYPPSLHQSTHGKVRIVANSWSTHANKGFSVYSFLDSNLDFSCYEFIFVGNSPSSFQNIIHIPPLSSKELANILRSSQLYLTASKHESCSNSLLEAIACGLTPIAINSGGNPELVGDSGFLFTGTDDILSTIDLAATKVLTKPLPTLSIDKVASRYYTFFQNVVANAESPTRLTLIQGFHLLLTAIFHRLYLRLSRFISFPIHR